MNTEIKSISDLFSSTKSALLHITPTRNIDSIKRDGLLIQYDHCSISPEKKGLFFIWKEDPRIVSAIGSDQVMGGHYQKLNPHNDFSIIKINLKKYKITIDDIAPDFNGESNEPNINSFCLRIIKDIEHIDPDDITSYSIENADLYGISYYDLEGYSIKNKPSDYDDDSIGRYRLVKWRDYEKDPMS